MQAARYVPDFIFLVPFYKLIRPLQPLFVSPSLLAEQVSRWIKNTNKWPNLGKYQDSDMDLDLSNLALRGEGNGISVIGISNDNIFRGEYNAFTYQLDNIC